MRELLQKSGRHHVVLIHHIRNQDEAVVPVLWLIEAGRPRIFLPLIDYFIDQERRGLNWKRQAARAVGLFYDFCLSFKFDDTNSILNPHSVTIKAFVKSLQTGTIPRKGIDESGLFWAPASANVVCETVRHLDQFIGFANSCVANKEANHPLKSLHAAFSAAPTNQEEMIRFLMTAKRKNSKSFMRHVKDDDVEAGRQQRAARDNLGIDKPAHNWTAVKAIDPTLVARIIEVGFLKNENAETLVDREDVTAKMIFLLLIGCGLRRSEPFHMWFNDITYPVLDNEERCLPMLRHPSEAGTYIVGENLNRAQYLRQIGMIPRHKSNLKAIHAGWKNLPVDRDTHQTETYFIHQTLEYEFQSYYSAYLDIRRDLMNARIQRGEGHHPFLFVSMGEDRSRGASCIGNPYSIPAFTNAWSRALNRVEKVFGEPIPRGKEHATTPHACRHRYGRILEEAGAPQKAIQSALNHRHPLSQKVYTEPEYHRVNAALQSARKDQESPLLNTKPTHQALYDETQELSDQWRY
ncbi:tyrosine-type recombinase/integrase [Sulfitobacter sp. 1A13191]|uniref:tyrosine-type recombinase/integrase n=1 Tax=Sulfitobacter sp. 1A13191 TaxID=3368589 RepID=UPI0037471C6B